MSSSSSHPTPNPPPYPPPRPMVSSHRNTPLTHQTMRRSDQKLSPSNQLKTNTTKRRKVAKACLFCKRSHMTCDDARPCNRCLKREIGHLCCDEPPSLQTLASAKPNSNHSEPSHQPSISGVITTTTTSSNNHHPSLSAYHPQSSAPSHLTPLPTHPTTTIDPSSDPFNLTSNPLSHLASLFSPRLLLSPSSSHSTLNHAPVDHSLAFLRSSNSIQLFEDLSTTNEAPDRLESTLFDSSKITPEPRSEESLIDLSEFLNAYPGLYADNGSNDHNLIPTNVLLDQSTTSSAPFHNDKLLSNPNASSFSHHSFLNPANPSHPQASAHKEDRLEQILRSSGLEAFNYSQSERELTDWITSKKCEPAKGKMLALWQESQNLFLTVTHQQNAEDPIELEYQFKRNLITCSPILDTLPIPGCIWRRTGEIYKTNEQFNNLIGIRFFACSSILSFLTRQKDSNFIKIHQLWDADSFLNFAEKFNRIALDEGQKAVLTSCVLHRFKEKEPTQSRPTSEKKLLNHTSLSSPSSSISSSIQSEKVADSQQLKQENFLHPTEDQIKEQENPAHDPLRRTNDKPYELNYSGKSMVAYDRINCTFSFTVRRDSYGLPCLIVGNFLPS